ncbi:N-acetyltransferase [Caballeronia sp. BR00000012568055]|uniref:GNAT family N-acetyltransferase n=1 Tax=Caballeronia sp. BR00000012568055 TaxID=2918761 RepID=UPI0023F76315|nr:GNAT family N-acetyltransferase [Caballeronia sp. BR00000012568055]
MTHQIKLRRALRSDVPFLLMLRKLTMTEHLKRVGMPTDDEAHYRRIWSNFEDAVIICEGNADVGLLKLSRANGEWHLHQIQILPSHQSKGIGKTVLGMLLNEAGLEGVRVSLSVVHENPARLLYEQLGFRSVEETALDAKLIWYP